MNGTIIRTILTMQSMSKNARLAVHNGVLEPTLMYGSECWVQQKRHESRVNTVEMRSLCGVTFRWWIEERGYTRTLQKR